MGVTLLHARKPADAFDCLIETVQLHHRDPLIWLRLAECCIQVHKPVTFLNGKQIVNSSCSTFTKII